MDIEEESQGYTYDNNLQYDFLGNKAGLSSSASQQLGLLFNSQGLDPQNIKAANVFKVDKRQTLQAVSAYTVYDTPTKVTTSIYSLDEGYTNPEDGTLLLAQTDDIDNCGLSTIKLEAPIQLNKGENFSVVQNIIYSDLEDADNNMVDLAGLPLEFGTDQPFSEDMPTDEGEPVKVTFDYKTFVRPNTSYVFGVIEDDSTSWYDVSDKTVQNDLAVPLFFIMGVMDSMAVPGNAMIKAYTTNSEADVPATNISVNNSSDIYLATTSGATNSIEVSANLTPENATTPVIWSIADNNIATIKGSGSTITLEAHNEGLTELTASSGEISATVNVIVSNSNVICSDILIEPEGPDYYTLTAKNVRSNPALYLTNQVVKVSMFSWSNQDQCSLQLVKSAIL